MGKVYDYNLLIPAHNEAKLLEKNVSKIYEFLTKRYKGSDRRWVISIIDNASCDKTASIIKRLVKKHKEIHSIHLSKKGKGYAVRKGLEESSAPLTGYIDADLPTSIYNIAKGFDFIQKTDFDIVYCNRVNKKMRIKLLRRIVSLGCRLTVRILFRTKIKDFQAGIKFFRAQKTLGILPLVTDNEFFFDTELLLASERKGLKISKIDIDYTHPQGRSSNVKLAKDSLKFLLRLIRYKIRILTE